MTIALIGIYKWILLKAKMVFLT